MIGGTVLTLGRGAGMRLFVAARLSEEMLDALAETSAALRGCVRGRYVAPDSFHVTLAFLGEVEGYRAGQAAEALECACRGFEAFPVLLGDFGSFGRRHAATLWQGFRDAGQLPRLAESVRRELKRDGFAFDEKNFLAHVTLMRAADLTGGLLPAPTPAEGLISNVALFRSDLFVGSYPVYTPVYELSLPN